jgi:hypothetical protein
MRSQKQRPNLVRQLGNWQHAKRSCVLQHLTFGERANRKIEALLPMCGKPTYQELLSPNDDGEFRHALDHAQDAGIPC